MAVEYPAMVNDVFGLEEEPKERGVLRGELGGEKSAAGESDQIFRSVQRGKLRLK